MAILLRFRCHGCGASRESDTKSAWTRCSFCQALLGFDWQVWFESDAYKQFLENAVANASKWPKYQEAEAAGKKAAGKGKHDAALAEFRKAVEILWALSPQICPPGAETKSDYREEVLRHESWWRLQLCLDPTLKASDATLQSVAAKTDWKNPLPSVKTCMAELRRQVQRASELDGFRDPDGMSVEARTRLVLSLFASAYLAMLSKAAQLELLREVHGPGNVREKGESPDEVGMFLDWTCPSCGLCSMQARASPQLTCPGCFFRQDFDPSVLGLSALSLKCGTCGAEVTLAKGALEASCGSCGAVVRRLSRTGDAERQFAKDAMAEHGGALPAAGPQQGFEVNASNRLAYVKLGLLRQASWYAALSPTERFVELAKKSFPAKSGPEVARALAEALASAPANNEQVTDEGRARIEEAVRALSAG